MAEVHHSSRVPAEVVLAPSSIPATRKNPITTRDLYGYVVPRELMKMGNEILPGKRDPHTLSNYDAWRSKRTTIDMEVNFDDQILEGFVCLTLERVMQDVREIILDTSYLDITFVKCDDGDVPFDVASVRTEPYGSPLTMRLNDEAIDEVTLCIGFKTTRRCTALQWLTSGFGTNGKRPYVFSQCQPIHARSVIPCQDTPDVKSTYDFRIRSPVPVIASGVTAGVSEFRNGAQGKSGTLLYTFRQSNPIPSYLVAIASGDLASAPIGPRSTVWASPELLRSCQWEFEADIETYIQIAESIIQPYEWTSYNVLVLPPSFPYGGMENPVFTFTTPTLISGDRQNIDVIAHELAHSWAGNMVSASSWQHFWLNEGWTTYIERRILANAYGNAFRDLSAMIGWKALSDCVKQLGDDHEYTKLVQTLHEKDPDEAITVVPYEKGFTFLCHLERLVSVHRWDEFMSHYFAAFKWRSIDSYEFRRCLIDFFGRNVDISKKLRAVDWDTWLHQAGLPPRPNFDTTLADQCYHLAARWTVLNDGSRNFKPDSKDVVAFTARQSIVFLETVRECKKPLSIKLSRLMGKVYGYTSSQNIEILSRYLTIGIRAGDEAACHAATDLVGRVGRRKILQYLYRELIAADRDLARKTFDENLASYHPIIVGVVRKLFLEVQ